MQRGCCPLFPKHTDLEIVPLTIGIWRTLPSECLWAERDHLTPPATLPPLGDSRGPPVLCVSPVFLPSWPLSFYRCDPFSLCSLPQPDYDVWILLTVVGIIFVVILALVLRIRCRPHHSRPVSRVGFLVEVGKRMCGGGWGAGREKVRKEGALMPMKQFTSTPLLSPPPLPACK